MNWNPFDLFKKTYDPFGNNDDLNMQNNLDLNTSHNTARSLFHNQIVESEFKRLQSSASIFCDTSTCNDTQNSDNNGY